MRTLADSGPMSLVFTVKIRRTVLRELFDLNVQTKISLDHTRVHDASHLEPSLLYP